MTSPLVSVVVPAHNASGTIRATIASIFAQTFRDFEVIVVDDGSQDDTAAVVQRVQPSDRVHLIRTPNAGPSAAKNTGARAAGARYVAFLDSDDLWLPTYLETMLATLRDTGGLAFTDAWVLDDPTGKVRRLTAMAREAAPAKLPDDGRRLFELLLERNFVYTSVTMERELLLRSGGYDERLWMAEDYELWLRLALGGCSMRRAPEVLAVHRNRPGSLTSDLSRLVAGRCEMYRIVAAEYDLPEELRARIRAQERHWRLQLARVDPAKSTMITRHVLPRLRGILRRIGPNPWLDPVPRAIAETIERAAVAGG